MSFKAQIRCSKLLSLLDEIMIEGWHLKKKNKTCNLKKIYINFDPKNIFIFIF